MINLCHILENVEIKKTLFIYYYYNFKKVERLAIVKERTEKIRSD
jgi:hypothetical protein